MIQNAAELLGYLKKKKQKTEPRPKNCTVSGN